MIDDKTDLYFTGKIWSAAYRKEKAAVILAGILGAAGISDTSITYPDVEPARFSTPTIPCRQLIDLLIDALTVHGFTGLTYFFDAKEVFHFGTVSDTGINEGEAYTFESTKNIIKTGSLRIETLPAPIWHTQKVTVNGGTLVMNTGAEINGNTSYSYGGGVFVGNNGTFTKQANGTIYGSNENDTLKNTARGDTYGHAVYVYTGSKKRNTTAGTGVRLNSGVSGSSGGWED